MWWTAALQAYQAQQQKDGGGGASGAAGLLQESSAQVGVTFDSSNWTVATGNASATGAPASLDRTALYVGAALAGLVIVAMIAARKR